MRGGETGTLKLVEIENTGWLDGLESGALNFEIADSSLAALELCEGTFLSHRHRCKVTFPLADFQSPVLNDWQPGEPYRGEDGGRDGRTLEGA